MSEDRIELMDLFRRDMTGIEPTRAWPEDQHPHPALKNHPKVFKFDQSTYLFKVWLAGREALAAQRDEGLAREAELREELRQMTVARDRWKFDYQNEQDTSGRLIERCDAIRQRLAEAEKALSSNPRAWITHGPCPVTGKEIQHVWAEKSEAEKHLRAIAYADGWKVSALIASPGCADGENAECAHSYANKLGCPECGEDFGK